MKKSFLLLLSFIPLTLYPQQHPLPLESASMIENGKAQFEISVSYFHDQFYPLSGLRGDLTKIGELRFAAAVSDFVELQADGTLLNLLQITERTPAFNSLRTVSSNPTADIGDLTFWTKIGLLNEYSSGLGFALRFGVQLPNASNESGLGIDEMNFFSTFLFQKHLAGVWTVNVGLGVLGDPTVVGQQHDVFVYAIGYMLPVSAATYFRVEYAGRRGHQGVAMYHLDNLTVALDQEFGDLTIRAAGISNFSAHDRSTGVELTAAFAFQLIEQN